MGIAEERFTGGKHICLIFETEAQRRMTVSEFLAAGLRRGEIVHCFSDATSPETIRGWMKEEGVEVLDAEARGAFTISSALGAYCPAGYFDPEATIRRVLQSFALAEQAGFAGSCISGEMSWVLKNVRGAQRFLEYEALLNTVTTSFLYEGMCQYDARLFDGATLFSVLQVHPFMVAQGQIVRNPYHLKPEEFLAKA